MEKTNLIATINRLLPSVDGEDENLITAAKLRTVLEAVYNAGVADALQNENVKVTGYGNKILSTAALPTSAESYAFSYDVALRKLQLDDSSMIVVGQHIKVIDLVNHVSADVIIEEFNANENYIIVSANTTLLQNDGDEMIRIYSDEFPLIYQSNIKANNTIVIGSNVDYQPDNAPLYLEFEIWKTISVEQSGTNPTNEFYNNGSQAYKKYLEAGKQYIIRDNDNGVDYPVTFVSAEIIFYYSENEGGFSLLKIITEETVNLSTADNWILVTDVIDDAQFRLIIQDGTHGNGKVLTCDANGMANWQTLNLSTILATYFRLQNGTQSAGKYLTCDANGVASWTAINLSSFNVTNYSSTSITLVLANAESYLRCNNANPIGVTVPPNSSVAFNIGTQISIEQTGLGTVTALAGAGVTLLGSPKTFAQYKIIQLVKVDTNTWVIIGGTD